METFLASFIMTIVMLVGTIGFSAGLTVQTSSTYESYIANGDSAVSQDAAEKYYLDAINVDPANPLAYQNFLKDVPLTRNFPKMSTTPLKMRYMNTRTNSNQSIRRNMPIMLHINSVRHCTFHMCRHHRNLKVRTLVWQA